MARHANRTKLTSVNGDFVKSISIREGYLMVDSGQAVQITSNREMAKGRPPAFMLRERRPSCRVVASLTARDMFASADAHKRQFMNRARTKVENWCSQHDTFAALVLPNGQAWTPVHQVSAQ